MQPGAAEAAAAVPARPRRDGTGRREDILAAALATFAGRGFAEARLDDVAAKAGVAKGTLYLYFRSKEELFEELVRSAIVPLLGTAAAVLEDPRLSPLDVLRRVFAFFEKEVLGTERRHIVRLVLAEGPRFPAIARFYHREVVSKGLAIGRELARRAVARGEFPTDAAVRFPQLLVAPLVVSVLWDALFSEFDPLDVRGFFEAHCQNLSGGRGFAPGSEAPPAAGGEP